MQSLNSNNGCSANFIVISLIPVLFFISILLGYTGLIPLNVPFHGFIIIGFILFIFMLFIKHNANYGICKMRLNSFRMEQELKSQLSLHSLDIHNENKSVLDIAKFLNHYYADIRNDNFVSVASSIFPMLGILGTFTAIAISMPNFSVTDTQALDNEISLLLSGVGSAFFASIYGILLSLIWTYFEKRGLSKIEHYFSDIKVAYSAQIWSHEELLIHEHKQNDLKDNRFVAALKETFNLDFIQALNEQHLASFKQIIHESNQNFVQISHHLQFVSLQLKETLSQIDTSKSAIEARNDIEKTLIDFTIATRSLDKNVKLFSSELDNSLHNTFQKIDFEIGNIVVKLADFATHVSLQNREIQESINKHHQMVANGAKVK
jgi:hypothetical protein